MREEGQRSVAALSSPACDSGASSRKLHAYDSTREYLGDVNVFAWSRDGEQLALARGNIISDVVLISDFR